MSNPKDIFNSTFTIDNINCVHLLISCDLNETEKTFSYDIYAYDMFRNSIPCKDNKNLLQCVKHKKEIIETPIDYSKLFDILFEDVNRYYICSRCEKGFYCDKFRGEDGCTFKCNKCIVNIVYLSKFKNNKNVCECYLCFNHELKQKCISNSNCCHREDNEKFICNICFDNIVAVEDYDEDEDIIRTVYKPCPLCRGKLDEI